MLHFKESPYEAYAKNNRLLSGAFYLLALIVILSLSACDNKSSSSSGKGKDPVDVVDPTPPPPDNGSDNGETTGPILPFPSYQPQWADAGVFSSAASCGGCHKASTDGSNIMRDPATGEDISPITAWGHSMMANSYPDPYFQAVLQNELAEFPALADFIEDTCLTCHTPMARTHAHHINPSPSDGDCNVFGNCYRLDDSLHQMHAREGISCTACHQMKPTDNDSGQYIISATDRIIYGPYEQPRSGAMRSQTQYNVAFSAHMSESKFCGGCHDLKTPSVDVNTGEVVSNFLFPEQTPYSEWLNSIYSQNGTQAQSCQDCHMPEVDNYATALAVRGDGSANPQWPSRDNYSVHSFVGANTYILSMIQAQRTTLGITEAKTVAGFQRQIDLNREYLANDTAKLSVASISWDSHLNIAIKIQNRSGHKLPTSYPSRRVWLNLIVSDNNGQILFQSGTPDSQGHLATDALHSRPHCTDVKKPADYKLQDCYTAHQNVITNEQQVAIYEAVMGDMNGHTNYMLLYGNHYIKDNRIPPIGYTELVDNKLFNPITAIAGAARNDADFNKADDGTQGTGSDIVHYQIPWEDHWPKDPANVQVEATFYYQTIRPAFVATLKRDNTMINHFTNSYQERPPQPEVIDKLSITLSP